MTRLRAAGFLARMEPRPLPRSRLNLWALSVIAQTVAAADHEPVKANPRLRLAMAWLTVSAGEGQALELFWQDAREVLPESETNYKNAYLRSSHLALSLQGLCERMGASYWEVCEYARGMNAEWP